ncbi:phosphotransferase [Candidatus Poribacteria bacterium]|nr:phosphotransferase [Candidatus Poribacteria bacterium]
MKYEIYIDREALIKRINQEYGISIKELTFIPAGEVGYCYIADSNDNKRYFLKYFGDSRLARISAERLDHYLFLTWQLHNKNILPNVPYPIKNISGSFRTDFENQPLVMFNYIQGEVIGFEDPLSDIVIKELGTIIGKLHKSTPELDIQGIKAEDYGIPFEPEMLNGFKAMESITSGDSRGKQQLRDMLLPRRDEVIGYLKRLKELQAIARKIDKPKVLCHTDLHGGNMIRGNSGELYILDWEGAILAPLEHDLFFIAWEDRFWEIFLPEYEQEFGPAKMNADVFGFYYYRRNLEDLTDWIVRILYENTTDEQDSYDLNGIEEDCISGWPYFEFTIGKIKTRLKYH